MQLIKLALRVHNFYLWDFYMNISYHKYPNNGMLHFMQNILHMFSLM